MKLPNRFRNLKFKKGSERGSVTLFVLIAMIFFLMLGLMIFIINMNVETSQKRDVEKIQSEYNKNANNTDLDQVYEEAKQKQIGKFFIKILDSYKQSYNSGEWINNDNRDRLPLTVEANWPKGVNCIEIVDHNDSGIRINNKEALNDLKFGKDNYGNYVEGQYQVTGKVEGEDDTKIFVNIDLTAPTASITPDSGIIWKGKTTGRATLADAKINAADNISGVKQVEYIVKKQTDPAPAATDEGWTKVENSSDTWQNIPVDIVLQDPDVDSKYIIYVKATDIAGNVSITPSQEYEIQIARATFDVGTAVNAKMKTLAGNENATHETADEKITSIVYNTEIPADKMTDAYKVSSADSKLPIYMWPTTDPEDETKVVMNWYSDDDTPYLNANSAYMFSDLQAVTQIAQLNKIDTSKSTTMEKLFKDCRALTSIDLSNFDTAKVTDMSYMFHDCVTLTTLDVSSLETQNVENMAWMFAGDNSNNTGTNQLMKLTSITGLTNFNTAKVTDMQRMFYLCTNMASVDVSSFDTSKVTNMSNMFAGAYPTSEQIYVKFAEIKGIENFNTSNVETMNGMFGLNSQLTSLDLSKWNTSKVTNMKAMFWFMTKLENLNISNFDTSKVTDMSWMFWNADKLTELDLRSFDTSNVLNFDYMFRNCAQLTTIYATDSFLIKSNATSSNMFLDCKKLVGGSGTSYSAEHVNADYAHIDGLNGLPGYFTNHYFIEFNANTENAQGTMTNQGIPFSYATNLKENGFTKDGYIFRGWATSPNGPVVYENGASMNYDLDGIKALVTDAQDKADDKHVTLKLYAVWSVKHYEVTYGSPAITKPAETLVEAMSLAQDNATIKVTLGFEDTSVTDANNAAQGVLVNKNVTIDTNGKILTMAETITVAANKTVTFVDTAETKGKLQRVVADGVRGDLITNNGTVVVGVENSDNGPTLTSKDIVINNGTVTVYSGNIASQGQSGFVSNAGIYSKTINVYGGNITNDSGAYGIVINLAGICNITGGRITGNKAICPQNGTLNISGSATIEGNAAIGSSASTKHNYTLNISGGVIRSTSRFAINADTPETNITITGGTITGATDGISITGANSTLTIGDKTNSLDRTAPVITGTTGKGINIAGATSTLNYYDGTIIGKEKGTKTFNGREVAFSVKDDTTVNFLTETEANNVTRYYRPYTRENTKTHLFETVLEKQVNVTFNPGEGATVAESNRNVLTNVEYKEKADTAEIASLPIPTKTGYTFKGWNGKNLVKPLTGQVTRNGITITPQEDGSVILNGTKTGDEAVIITGLFEVKANVQYIVSIGERGNIQDYGLKGFATDKSINHPLDFTSAGIQLVIPNGTVISDVRLYPQIELGTTATAYEPYFVTDDILVTKDTDHTLTAIWEANKYTVHFNGDGSTAGTVEDQKFKYNEEKALNENKFERKYQVNYNGNEGTPSKANDTATYTFKNWVNKDDNKEYEDKQSVKNLTAEADGEVTLYAVWTPHEVTLPTATREGYIFNGWYDAATGGNKIGNAGDKYIPEANTTLHAQWRQVHYTVSVGEENLPAEIMQEAIKLAEDRITGSVTTATITATMNYTDASTANITKNITINIPSGLTITMANTITVANTGTVTFTGAGTIQRTTGDLITNNGNIVVNDLTMSSNNCVINGGNSVTVNSGNLNSSDTAVIIASYITVNNGNIISQGRYGISSRAVCDIKGGKVEGATLGVCPSNGTLKISGTAEIKGGVCGIGSDAPSHSYTLEMTGGTVIGTANHGIYSKSKNTNITITGGTITGGINSIHIEGENNTVTITGGTITGGTQGIRITGANSTVTIGDYTNALDRTSLVITGTTGHSVNITGATSTLNFYDGKLIGGKHDKMYSGRDVTFSVANDTTVTPLTGHKPYTRENSETHKFETVLEKQVKVTFNPGEGTTVAETERNVLTNVEYKEKAEDASKVNLPTPTRTGYTFKGWKINGAGDYITNDTKVVQDQDHTLNAVWEANPYKVRFNKNANDATGTMANQNFNYDEEKALTANTFTRSGYVFAGWNTKADLTGTLYQDKQSVKNLISTSGGVFDLYARWLKIEFTPSTTYISKTVPYNAALIGPSSNTNAKVKYSGENLSTLTFEIEDGSTNVMTVTTDTSTYKQATVLSASGATDGASKKVIVKDKETGTKIGEVTVTIDLTPPTWTVKLKSIVPTTE